MKPSIKTMRVVLFQEGEWLCAQVLEYDLAVQAKSLPSVYRQLHRMLQGHIAVRLAHGKQPFQDLRPAPRKYWTMFRRSKIPLPTQMFPSPLAHRKIRIPRPEVHVAGPIAAQFGLDD